MVVVVVGSGVVLVVVVGAEVVVVVGSGVVLVVVVGAEVVVVVVPTLYSTAPIVGAVEDLVTPR